VVVPAGTVVVISELDTTLNLAAVPLKVTLVAPVRPVPRILTVTPTLPEVGSVSTNAQAHSQAKDRAIAVGPARGGCAVESPVGGLTEPRRVTRRHVATVQRRQRAPA
jgi:hypothetical protein